MKSLLRALITKLLVFRARQFLKAHRSQVIAVTGSVGKTSTKQAIYTILKNHPSASSGQVFNTYVSPEGFNTELGISLAILQEEESGFSSPWRWVKILKRVFFEKKQPYQKMVLEMGADTCGDIAKLTRLVHPFIGVVTAVAPVHLESGQFKDLHAIAQEKGELVARLPKEGVAILNEDDPLVREMKTPAHVLRYGTALSADLRATDVETTTRQLRFIVHYKNEAAPFDVPVLGSFQLYVLLPAIAVGVSLGLTLEQCAKALFQFRLPAGRMTPIDGINKSHLIDSSYNASPVSMTAALNLLGELKAGRKIAALGTMNELGEMSHEAHLTLGKQAAAVAEFLIAVGPEAAVIKKGAMDSGMPESQIYTFFDSEEAGHFLAKQLQPKDLVLVKGSQNRVRMERLTKLLMAHPEQAHELLCRQDKEWEKI